MSAERLGHGASRPSTPSSPPTAHTTATQESTSTDLVDTTPDALPADLVIPPASSPLCRKRASETDSAVLEASEAHQVKRVLTHDQIQIHQSTAPHAITAASEQILICEEPEIDAGPQQKQVVATPPDSSPSCRKRASETHCAEFEADESHRFKRVLEIAAHKPVLTNGELKIDTEQRRKQVVTEDNCQDLRSTAPTTPVSPIANSPAVEDYVSPITSRETSAAGDVKPSSEVVVATSEDATVQKSGTILETVQASALAQEGKSTEKIEPVHDGTTAVQEAVAIKSGESSEPNETRGLEDEVEEKAEESPLLTEGLDIDFVVCKGTAVEDIVARDATAQEAHCESKKVSSDPSICQGVPPKGFFNDNVNCYRIVALQQILNQIKYVNWFLTYHPKESCVTDDGPCITCILRDMVTSYWSGAGAVDFEMRRLGEYCSAKEYNCGGINGQGDPDDFFRWMMNRMEEEIPKELYRIFRSIGDIIQETTMRCDLCGYVSARKNVHEGFLSLSLSCNPPQDDEGYAFLDDLMAINKDEAIKGHRCDSCKQVSTKEKVRKISHAPDVLTISINRNDASGRKNEMKIDYPQVLDLDSIVGCLAKDPTTPSAKYAINSIITHTGDGTSCGHYRIIARHPGDGGWRLYDDNKVHRCTTKAVLDVPFHFQDQSPYILSYTKIVEGDESGPQS